ncbi:MAG: hypothetical protein V3S30_08140 [Thermoanaerobaculia bacterium]
MITLTESQAIEIYQVLVRHKVAKPEFRPQFIHDQVRGQYPLDWELKSPLGFGGNFYRGPGPAGVDEWIVTKHMDDETPRTQATVDAVNLELAQLQNTLFP